MIYCKTLEKYYPKEEKLWKPKILCYMFLRIFVPRSVIVK